jgi:hypothetical protein
MKASRLALLLLCAAFSAAEARADVKIKTRQTANGQTSEGATYIKGKRQRTESGGSQMIVIQACDLKRDLQIMPQAKAYVVRLYDDASAATTKPAGAERVTNTATQGGVVTSTSTTKDTGERKQIFGYTARHIITTFVTESSPDSCSPVNSKMETDGWYIDAAFALDCDAARASVYRQQSNVAGCRDKYQTKQIGTAKRGFAVWEKMTMFGPDGSVSFSMVNEVVELSQATLDAALFDVPAGYREVKDFSEAYASSAAADAADSNAAAGADSSSSANAMSASNAQTQQGALGAKKAGVIRLGLVGVTTGSVAEHIRAADLAAAVEGTLAGRLKSPNVEMVRIDATMPSQIESEAKQKECDFVVYTNVSHKKGGGGGFGGMLGKVSDAVVMASGGDAGNGDGQASSGNATAATVSAGVKSKDELTLDLRVQTPGSASPTAARQFKAKAKSAGEDIISPVAEQAAQVVLAAAATK